MRFPDWFAFEPLPTMCSVVVAVLIALLLEAVVSNKFDRDYPVFSARCNAKCLANFKWTAAKHQKPFKQYPFNSCVKECMQQKWVKPGLCPNGTSNSVFEETCFFSCKVDVDCPGVEKCCPHNCGAACRIPERLSQLPNLPEIPKNIVITEKVERNDSFETLHSTATWSLTRNDDKNLVFLVEERHHEGCETSEKNFSQWTLARRELRPRVNLLAIVGPGRWYQIRVAAVNENGTKGFSEPSKSFKISFEPLAPEAPINVTIKAMAMIQGSIWAELRWKAPFSDMPIARYKVCWAYSLDPDLDYEHNLLSSPLSQPERIYSVVVNCSWVPGDQHLFFIKDLNVTNEYMIQVQAFSNYCRKKLNGTTTDLKCSILEGDGEFWWTVTDLSSTYSNKMLSLDKRLSAPEVEKVSWTNNQLIARVKWKPLHNLHNIIYEISWHQTDCQTGHKALLAATTDSTTYDLNSLKFNTKYKVTVKARSFMKIYVNFTILKTPACEDLDSKDASFCRTHSKKLIDQKSTRYPKKM